MKIFALLIAILFLNFQVQSQDGTLVTSFGDNGLAITEILDEDSELHDVIYFNGFYYAVGVADVDGRGEFLIIKADNDGDLVSGFGTGGYISIPKGSGISELTKIETSTDGKLLTSGWMRDGNNEVAVIVKFDENGVLDNSFSDDGIAEIRISSSSFGEDRVTNIIQKNDRIYFSSPSYTGLNDEIGIACIESNGEFCNDFANGGKKNIKIPDAIGSYGARAIVDHPEGGFIITGNVKFGFSEEPSMYLYKIDDAGETDNTFGNDGFVTFSLGADISTGVSDLIIDSENKIVTGGGAFNTEELDNNFFISRFNLDGTMDESFGNNGVNVLQLIANESIRDLLLNPNGTIIAVGGTGGFPSNLMIARYGSDGQLDNTFGNDGYTITSVTSNFNSLSGVDFGPNNTLIAAGFSKLTSRRTLLASYKNTISTNTINIESVDGLSIFPNPIKSNLGISYVSDINEVVTLSLFDILGNKILSKTFPVLSGKNSLELSELDNLASGQLFVMFTTESGKILVSQISKI